jgi:hypothetical protein
MEPMIYPNPVENSLDWVRLLETLEGRGMLGPFATQVVGVNGAVVASTVGRLEGDVLIPNEVIGELSSGLYVLMVVDSRGEKALFRFLKA